LSVEGSDVNTVNNVYREVEREVQSRQIGDDKVVRSLGFASLVVGGCLGAILLVTLAEPFASIMSTLLPGDAWAWMREAAVVGAALILIAGPATVGVKMQVMLNRAFPSVEFVGKVADPGTSTRGTAKWVTAVVVVPTLIALVFWLCGFSQSHR